MPPPTKSVNGITGADIVSDARRYLGVPYKYGGTSRSSGLDCSGLILVVCEDLGIASCPRTSEEQWGWVKRITSPATGDLVFFVGDEMDPPPGHVGILYAPGQMINAPFTGTVVRTDNFSATGTGTGKIIGYGRIPGVAGSPSSNPSLTSTMPPAKSSQENLAAGAIASTVSWIAIALAFAVIIGLLILLGIFTFH
jgi:hypothetical protein